MWDGVADGLPPAQQTAVLTRLDAYLADTRGWHAGVTALADLATVAPRYEPSGRQWAMRVLAEVMASGSPSSTGRGYGSTR